VLRHLARWLKCGHVHEVGEELVGLVANGIAVFKIQVIVE